MYPSPTLLLRVVDFLWDAGWVGMSINDIVFARTCEWGLRLTCHIPRVAYGKLECCKTKSKVLHVAKFQMLDVFCIR